MDVGDGQSGNGGGGGSGAPQNGGAPSSGAQDGGASASTTTPTSLAAACAAPHGTSTTPTTAAQLTSIVARAWYRCSPRTAPSSLYQIEDGIEYTADGHFYLLRQNASGGFDRMAPPSEAGTWAINGPNGIVPQSDTSAPIHQALFMYYAGTSFGDGVSFEVDPMRLEVTEIQTSNGAQTWFVPITP